MPEANPMNNMIAAMLFGPDTQAKLMAAQQQQALADAILSEGIKPVSTDNRQIGGVGYSISPFEGLAKMADIISGKYQQNKAIDAYKDIYSGSSQQGTAGQLGNMLSPSIAGLSPLEQMEILNGNRAVAEMVRPTEQQKNFGTQMPQYVQNELGKGYYGANPGAAAMQTGLGTSAAEMQPPGTMPQGAPQLGTQPPITPVQGPQALDTTTTMPSQAAALQQYRQENGMPTPPIDNERQQMGLPIGAATPPPSLPQLAQANPEAVAGAQAQLAASQLAPPSPLAAAVSGQGTPPPNPQNYQTMGAYKGAMKAWEAGQTEAAKVKPLGDAAAATKMGSDLADISKTYNVAAGNLPRAMQRFAQLRQAAKDASSGGGVDEEAPGSYLGDYARNYARTTAGQFFEPKKAMANQIIDQATKQGVLSELGPQLAGLRGNKFLESIASGASGLNPADPPDVKINGINGLQDQYISSLKSLADQRRSYGEKNAPSDLELAHQISQYADPTTKISVIDPKGILGRVDPGHLVDLIQSGGKLR